MLFAYHDRDMHDASSSIALTALNLITEYIDHTSIHAVINFIITRVNTESGIHLATRMRGYRSLMIMIIIIIYYSVHGCYAV